MTSPAAKRVRGTLAALALLAFVAGIPCGLLALGADPARLIPERWPDPVQITQWPEQIWATLRWAWITGDLVIWLIVAVAWTGWLALTVSVIGEVIRQTGRAARGPLRRIPTGRWIAGLVAAVLIATSAGTAAASGLPATPITATAPPRPHPNPASAPRDSTAATATTTTHGAIPYTVVHGDTLWDLAERHLGDGRRYHEIVRLNPTLLAGNPDDLEPAWTLLLPLDAAGLPPRHDTTSETVTVQPADTLTGIAERHLGDQDAWRALFDLNAGRPQPDGRALRHPDQLLPGWTLALPATAPTAPPAEIQEPPPSVSAPELPDDPPPTGQTPPPTPGGELQKPAASGDGGVSLPGGAFVGLGLAALITLATVTVRMRRRRWYRPGVRTDDDPTGLPVVRALRIAHDAATQPPADQETPATEPTNSRHSRLVELDTRDRAKAVVRAAHPTTPGTAVGIRDGHTIALDLARTQGLGLVGPGARSAARALIVTLLAQAASDNLDATIVIPHRVACSLLGDTLPDRVPRRLRIVDALPAALDVLEAELLARTHGQSLAGNDPDTQTPRPSSRSGPFLIVAAPSADADRRLHTILETGAHLGLAGLLLGPWRPGGTVRVTVDGIVDTASPALTSNLAGARLFTLPDADARDLLALLHAVKPDRAEPSQQHTSVEPAATTVSDYEFSKAGPEHDAETEPARTQQGIGPAETHHADRSPDRSLRLHVVGRLRLNRTGPEPYDLVEALAPRQREILVYLALHREGCRRETLSAALWPDAPAERPYNTFHATLSQLRRSLRRATENDALDIITTQDGHYALNEQLVTVDLWQLHDALTASRTSTPADATEALNAAIALYRGDLAEGITADWIDGPREALRRDVLDAFGTLIRATRRDAPEHSLALLEHARRLDPYNEAIYRDLMRTQARLGQYDNIPRTLRLLATVFSELGEHPARDTAALAAALQQPGNGIPGRRAS
ncbi:Putative transcriptional regulator,LysM domain-containing protein [Amycolatopsis japonica]|uniref:Putative transcriptional regulator,LysM domain-containing protein n=1 Tax=Amycolatopsis japonica TaxID=208439 RepID=A0A075UPR2_9PSEU|nr:BTAD domain-containing putative transcriptional regulator [Amycolatopsis japonica]AIG74391.1 Putative transcriptional regulator,LysM domain-containing protein [Amycolatopsis japonica]